MIKRCDVLIWLLIYKFCFILHSNILYNVTIHTKVPLIRVIIASVFIFYVLLFPTLPIHYETKSF